MKPIQESFELVLFLALLTSYNCDAVCTYNQTCNDASLDCTNLNITLALGSLFTGIYNSVYHCTDGKWYNIPGCENLTAGETCSLSATIAYNRIDNYNKMLIASSNTECGFDFMPYKCATIGAPDIGKVEIGKDHVLLDVKAPQTPYTHPITGNTTYIRMDELFGSIIYRATLMDPSIQRQQRRRRRGRSVHDGELESNSGWFRFEQLSSGTEYLIDVTAYLEYREGDTVSFLVETQAINECFGLDDQETCDLYADCVNTSQTDRFRCECQPGWTGNGLECKDIEKPVITNMPHDIHKEATLLRMFAEVTWAEPSSEDNSGSCTLISDYQPGATFPFGDSVVTYTAIDAANNKETAIFVVHIRGVRSVLSIVMIISSVFLLYMIVKLRQCDRSSSRKFKGIDPIKSRTLARTIGASGYTPAYKKEQEIFDECSTTVAAMTVTVNPLSPPLSTVNPSPPPTVINPLSPPPPYNADTPSNEMSSDSYGHSDNSEHSATDQTSSGLSELAATCGDIDMVEVDQSFQTVISKEKNDITTWEGDVIGEEYDVSDMVAPKEDYSSEYSIASSLVPHAAPRMNNNADGLVKVGITHGAGAGQNLNPFGGYVLDERRPLLSRNNSSNEGFRSVAQCNDHISEITDKTLSNDPSECLETEHLTTMEKFCADKLAAIPSTGLPSPGYSKLSQICIDNLKI